MKEINELELLEQEINSNNLVLLKIGSEWCGPCKAIEKIIENDIEPNYSSVDFVKVNTDEADDIVENLDIMSIPVLHLYKNGKLEKTIIGTTQKNKIIELLDNELTEN